MNEKPELPDFDEQNLSSFINDIESTEEEMDLDSLLREIEVNLENNQEYSELFMQSPSEDTKLIQEQINPLKKENNVEDNQEDIEPLSLIQTHSEETAIIQEEDPEKLLQQLKKEIYNNPSDYKIRREYAETLLDQNYLEEALAEFNILINIFNDDASLYFSIGLVYDKLDEFKEARIYYEKSIELCPDEPDFHYNKAFLLDRNGYINEAIAEFQITINLSPKDQHSHFNLGCLYSKLNNLEKSIYHFEVSIQLNDQDVYAHYNLAYEYKKIKNIPKALEEYNKVLELNPDYSWAYYNLGCIYYEAGEIEDSLNFFEKVFEINPLDIDALKTIVSISLKIQEYKRAIYSVEIGLNHNPNNGEIFYQLARVHKAQNNIDDAIASLEKAIKNPKSLKVNIEKVKAELNALKKIN